MSIRALNVPPPKDDWLRAELAPGEIVTWSGEPTPRYAAPGAVGVALFGLHFGGFAAFWIVMAARGASDAEGPFSLFPLFGLPFLATGIGMMSAPWLARRKLERTAYAVTDRRALIVEHGIRGDRQIRSITRDALAPLAKSVRTDGAIDLMFFAPKIDDGERSAPSIGFIGLRDGRAAETALEALRTGERAAEQPTRAR